MKEHATLEDTKAPKPSKVVPADLQELSNNELTFLARRGIHLACLHKAGFVARYSPSGKRIVLQYNQAYFGRDVTNCSNAKWISYTKENYLVIRRGTVQNPAAIVVEDLLSAAKVLYACPQYDVVCTLGTGQSKAAVLALSNYKELLWMYDGDSAGYDGTVLGMKKLKPFVQKQVAVPVPSGYDPKDLSITSIRVCIEQARGVSLWERI